MTYFIFFFSYEILEICYTFYTFITFQFELVTFQVQSNLMWLEEPYWPVGYTKKLISFLAMED